MNIIIKKVLLAIYFLYMFFPVATYAAEIYFETQGGSNLGGEFIVTAKLNTEGELINAIEGKINLPADLVEIKDIRDGTSVLNFWIDRPSIVDGTLIRFSGITPGGFTGENNVLFSMVLESIKVGKATIYADGIRSFVNDEESTSVKVRNKSLSIVISEEAQKDTSTDIDELDTEKPESFTPIITSDPYIFDGKYFLVFASQDKAFGIDHYEIREGEEGEFREVASPYLLENQTLDKKIFVKAIDKSGNERLEVVELENELKLYLKLIIFAIIIMLFGFIFFKRHGKNI